MPSPEIDLIKRDNPLEQVMAQHGLKLQRRGGRFVAVLCLAWPDGHDEVYEGSVAGRLVWPIRGKLGHGYDPMFQPDGKRQTFAEMEPSEKNGISHRARAMQALLAHRFT